MTVWTTTLLGQATEAVVLFGSKSRGDADKGSDTDLAIFAKADSPTSLIAIKQAISKEVRDESANLSVYSLATAELMAADGSLFLWHLKLEGKVLFKRSEWTDRLFRRLAPYSRTKAIRDMNTFEHVLHDIADSLKATQTTTLFEAATLFSILRSLGMIVTTLVGSPCFGRLDPIFRTRELMGECFPFTEEETRVLLAAKLVYSRKMAEAALELTPAWCDRVRNKTLEVLSFARGIANEASH